MESEERDSILCNSRPQPKERCDVVMEMVRSYVYGGLLGEVWRVVNEKMRGLINAMEDEQ